MIPRICGFLIIMRLTEGDVTGLCRFKDLSTHNNSYIQNSVCDNMAPKNGLNPPQTTTSPWKIFTYKDVIEQLHSQPVTLGSEDGKVLFNGYVITAKRIEPENKLGAVIGHFEPQWDASPICCGDGNVPNMLESANDRVKLANQTLLWTAPNDYKGPYVFVATLWKSSRLYWLNVTSQVMNIIPQR